MEKFISEWLGLEAKLKNYMTEEEGFKMVFKRWMGLRQIGKDQEEMPWMKATGHPYKSRCVKNSVECKARQVGYGRLYLLSLNTSWSVTAWAAIALRTIQSFIGKGMSPRDEPPNPKWTKNKRGNLYGNPFMLLTKVLFPLHCPSHRVQRGLHRTSI